MRRFALLSLYQVKGDIPIDLIKAEGWDVVENLHFAIELGIESKWCLNAVRKGSLRMERGVWGNNFLFPRDGTDG